METIKEILMKRDNMSENEADTLIKEATEQFNAYLSVGNEAAAEQICEDYFGLEPDFIMELF